MIKKFLRLFWIFRRMEKMLQNKDAAIFELNDVIAALNKKIVSDSNLIESLNRHIEALEGKAAMQTELIQELREKLKALVPNPQKNKEDSF